MVEPFTQSGIGIDAAVSKELLYSIFVPAFRNPTHDGAVIIKSLRIARAGSSSLDQDDDLARNWHAAPRPSASRRSRTP